MTTKRHKRLKKGHKIASDKTLPQRHTTLPKKTPSNHRETQATCKTTVTKRPQMQNTNETTAMRHKTNRQRYKTTKITTADEK